jgi:cardiolipin synthase
VEVRLLVDAAGYQRGLIAKMGGMNGPNLEARVFNPFFLSWTIIRGNNRDHRKILVVDGRYAVMGGINLSGEQLGDGVTGWRDTALLVEGSAAGGAERIFAETWAQGGRGWFGKTLPVSFLNPIKKAVDAPFQRLGEEVFGAEPPFDPEGDPDDDANAAADRPAIFPDDFYDTTGASVRAIGSSPDDWASGTHDVAVAGILGARERIDAAYAYFVPPREALSALLAAAERGVRVRLLLPGVTDVRFVREIGMKQYGKLLEAGVEIYEWPHPILHSKTMAVDGKWVLVGSANMDSRSYFLNYEAVFAVADEKLAEAAHRAFEADLAESSRVTLSSWRQRGMKQRLLEIFLTPAAGQF